MSAPVSDRAEVKRLIEYHRASPRAAAGAIVAAGFARPRVVTTAAELDSMDWPVVAVGDGWADLISEGENAELVDFPCLVFTIPAWSPPAETDGAER